MTKQSGFHVRHDLQPALTSELIMLLQSQPTSQTEKDLQQSAEVNGLRLRERKDYGKLLKSLEELNIVEEEEKAYKLTSVGKTISRITLYQKDLLADFIHFLYYTSYALDPEKRFSWSYRQVCDVLWLTAPSVINRDRLVNQVTREASNEFGINGISFSISSVAGVVNWITELLPQYILMKGSDFHFVRREYCSIELFVLSLHHIYKLRKSLDSTYLPITSDVRYEVSKLCLMAPEGFQEMLNQAESSFTCIDVRRERGERVSMDNFDWSILEN